MKIKGPFGEVEVKDGALVKGVSPCKSCGKEQDCQAMELCDAKFGGWVPVEEPVHRTTAPKMDLIKRTIEQGAKYPYDDQPRKYNWVYRAARGICYDLCDRRGIKHEMGNIDADVRDELVDTMAAIIAQAAATEIAANAAAGERVAKGLEDELFTRPTRTLS